MAPSRSQSNLNTGLCQPCEDPALPTVSKTCNMKDSQNCTNGNSKTTCSCKPNCGRCKVRKAYPPLALCKYQQPEVPTSYKPAGSYLASVAKIDDQTVYRNSYMACELTKCNQIIPPNNLATGEGKVSNDTVHNTSYQRYEGALPAVPHKPCRHNLLGVGRLEAITTHQHDYIPKPIDVPLSFKPVQSVLESDLPISNKTTNRLSYTVVDMNEAKVKSYRPCREYKAATSKMDCKTTHRLSYSRYQPQKPVDKPWAARKPYSEPQSHMSGQTVYSSSYQPCNGDPRQNPFKPSSTYIPPTLKMQHGTTYRKSYQNTVLEKPVSYKPINTIGKVEGKMSGDTIHKLAYQGYKNALPARIFKPGRHKYTNDDPMQDVTTHKHDYIVKPLEKSVSYRPTESFCPSDSPFTNLTTNRLSYKPYLGNIERVQPKMLKGEIPLPSGKVEDKTTNNLSYLPWKPQQKEKYPWVPHGKYEEPTERMAGTTIQALSYQLPGSYIPCAKDDPDCIPCVPQPEVAVEEEPCCATCCGQFPVAAC